MKINIHEERGKNQLIDVEKIREFVNANHGNLTLVFESGNVDDEYRNSLQQELPKHVVFNVRRKPEIWIRPSIETDEILAKQEEIHKATTSFRKDGIRLMKILGEEYQINPFNSRELFELKRQSRDNKQRGRVNEDWSFWFHGAECQFENRVTGQIVELVITNGPEFGALDSFFFLRYLKTTPKFEELANFFSDDIGAVTKALIILEDLGKIQRINNISQRGIIPK